MINLMTLISIIVNFNFLDGDVPGRPSYGGYISQLIRFARVCRHVVDCNARKKYLTAKLLKQGYRYHKLRKASFKFYCRHYELILKFIVGLRSLLHEGLSVPEFYGDLVNKFKIMGRTDFSDQFQKITRMMFIKHYAPNRCLCIKVAKSTMCN